MSLKTMRVFKVVNPIRLRGRVVWPNDRIILRADEADPLVKTGDVVLAEPTARTPWGEPMLHR